MFKKYQKYYHESSVKLTDAEPVSPYVQFMPKVHELIQSKRQFIRKTLALKHHLSSDLIEKAKAKYNNAQFDGRIFIEVWHSFVSNKVLGFIKELMEGNREEEEEPHVIVKLFENMQSTTSFFKSYAQGVQLEKQVQSALVSYTLFAWNHFKKMNMKPPTGVVLPEDVDAKKEQIDAFLVPFQSVHGILEWSRRFEALEKEVQQYLETLRDHDEILQHIHSRISCLID